MNMNFDKEFNTNWNNFLTNKNLTYLHKVIDLIVDYFSEQLDIEPHDVIKLFPVSNESSSDNSSSNIISNEELLLAFNWPDQIFYFLNEELANLNRELINKTNSSQNLELTSQDIYAKILKILKTCFILSKNFKCLSLITNTSLINQYLSSYSFILNSFNSDDTIKTYFKLICFLIIRAHDPYLNWFKKFYSIDKRYVNLKPLQSNFNQRLISFKFDPLFFSFLFDSFKIFKNKNDFSTLAIHSYACILNEITTNINPINYSNNFSSTTNLISSPNLNDNLIRAITPQIIEFLFNIFYTNENKSDYYILNDEFINLINKQDNSLEDNTSVIFYDEKLIACRLLPLIVNVLHLSLPDKRLVDLNQVLEKSLQTLEKVKCDFIKFEIIRSYLNMVTECTDRAALKIVIVSKRFFICLLEQLRLICLTNNSNNNINEKKKNFLHEFIFVVLDLIKNLLDNSQPVKDIFSDCKCYDLLYEILKDTNVIDVQICTLINEMISEKIIKRLKPNQEQISKSYIDELENTEMVVLLIKLLPFMQQAAQEFSLNTICRLCPLNARNQLQSCKNTLLFNLIKLLQLHNNFTIRSRGKLFRTIQYLGRCSISQNELKELIELLQPRKQFPFGIHVLRCFLQWAKTTSSIGLNLGLLSLINDPNKDAQATSNMTQSELENNNSNLAKLRRTSVININQNALMNLMRTTGTGALSQNAQQQAKYFFDFQHSNSGIRVPAIKKWPGYAFSFHCWVKLRSDLEIFDKKRRQLYSFYNDYGQGFEAFFTPDCSSLVVSVCTKKDFISVQLRELDFDSSQSVNQLNSNFSDETHKSFSTNTNINLNNITNTSDYWHSITIVHVPAKNPFGYSQICIYIDGVLKKETDLKLPNFGDSFNHIRIGAACSRPISQTSNFNMTNSLAAPLNNLKNVFNIAYKSGEKSLNVTTIPAGSQDTVWDVSTCLMGHMSSCFALFDVMSDLQARLLYEIGPNQYSINWLDILELNDFRNKFLFYYDAKCVKDLTCIDLSTNKMSGKFTGIVHSCDNFKESLNSIGSIQIFYPLLNYLTSNQDYLDLVTNEWHMNSKQAKITEKLSNNELDSLFKSKLNITRKSSFDDSELEQNVVSLILNLMRYLFHNSDLIQDRFQRNNGIALLGFLLQRLPKRFIDINLLRIIQEYINEASHLTNKTLLNEIYEHLIFDFRIWNKADYEIRIGHIQYISTIIKDDKKHFRKKYGIQFFLDIIRTYFGSNSKIYNSLHNTNETTNFNLNPNNLLVEQQNQTQMIGQVDDEDLRNLRNSFFGLIKYYSQKDIKINELNAMISFLATTRNVCFQSDLLDVLISLLEAPNSNDQLYLLLYEPNVADGLYSMLTQTDLNEQIQRKLLKMIKILLKTKKVYEKNKARMRLDDCGTYAGLVSKLTSEYLHHPQISYQNTFNENLPIDMLENFLLDEYNISNYDNLWHIMSLLNLSPICLINDTEQLIKTRLKVCEIIIKFIFSNVNMIRYLVKTAAWQDTICQFFCVGKKNLPQNVARNDGNNIPPIVVSSSSYMNENSTKVDEEDIENVDEISDEWENLESSEVEAENSNKPDDEKLSLLTSTPSGRKKNSSQNEKIKKSKDYSKNITSTMVKKDISKSAVSSEKSSNVKKNLKMQNLSKIDYSNNENLIDEMNMSKNTNQKLDLFSFSSPEISNMDTNNVQQNAAFFGTGIGGKVDLNNDDMNSLDMNNGTNLNKQNEADSELEKNLARISETHDLFENLIFIINKMLWEGVLGSNEDAWKERCQIFSSLNRLSKEYNFLKPIEVIELRLLETSVKHCVSDAKKQTTSKEHGSIIENSREIIKLVDYYVSQNSLLSEKLVSSTISLLDQIRAFDQKISPTPNNPIQTNSPKNSNLNDSKSSTKSIEFSKVNSTNSLGAATTNISPSLLGSYGIIHDEWAETSYLGMNILINVLSSYNIEICAQASAKINTILHSRSILNSEEACYLIASIEKVMFERLNYENEQYYAFLIPIMKSLIEKCYTLIQMNVQVPNIPFSNISPTFYEDFKEYCKTDEWRIFIQKQVLPLKEQYLAMTINPCQMNMKIWWNMCYESLMVSIHKRNRVLGEAKIKFEDTISNQWKEREKQENIRYQTYLLQLKRNDLAMRKQLHGTLRFFTSEIGSWNEGIKENYWMLSNHETRERMRCKLVENLKFDSHFEASRLRDYSGLEMNTTMSTLIASNNQNIEDRKNKTTDNLAHNLQLNKEAINTQIKEDAVGDDEFIQLQQQQQQHQQAQQIQSETNSNRPLLTADSNTSSTNSSRKTSTTTINSQMTSSNISVNKPISIQERYEQTFPQLEEKEKLILRSECELITVTRVIKGRFELSNKYIYFYDLFSRFYHKDQTQNDSNDNISEQNIFNSNSSTNLNANNYSYNGFNCSDFDILNDFKIPLTQLKEVQLRRYNLRRSALEFFLINHTNYFINFNKNIRNRIYSKIVSMKLPYLQSNTSVRTSADLLKASDYTQKWLNHEMTNFDYLMKLNTIAGRTYNDLTQYPVFPWILKDYTSENLDLYNPNVYRDLSKPIGVQNPKYEDYVRQKYELFEDPTGAMRPFHYGTHYSNSANVMHYLIRLEPFTTLHIQLQSDRFDVADRQFHSIASSWRILYENPSDVKELIPEFYYLPEFLINMNNFDFGELQSNKNKVNDVTLPVWSKSPEHFIYLHRKALESDYVSEHLHEWIDLIFGYKQQGQEAEKALNVFMYCSYEGAIDLDAITDPVTRHATEGMISNFGQTPTQLLKEPHPKRKSREQSIKDKIIQGKPVILWHQINNLKAFYVDFCDIKKDEPIDPVIFISIPRYNSKSFMQQGLSDPLISISQSGVIGVNGWQAYERSITNLFSFDKDPSLLNEKKSIAGPFEPNFELDYKVFVLTHDSKLLISGGHWDNSLRVFSLTKYRNIAQIYQHSSIVTCLAIDYTGLYVVSGSMDSTCMVWQVTQEYGYSVNIEPTPLHVLYGHEGAVTSVEVSNELDMIVSGSIDGTVNIHTLRNGYFVQTLSFKNENISLFTTINVKLSNQRHILVYASAILNDNDYTNNIVDRFKEPTYHEIFVYSINGKLISRELLNHPVQDMIIKDNYCILALLINNRFNTNQKEKQNLSLNSSYGQAENESDLKKGNQIISKILFKEYYDLKTIQTMRLKSPITCMYLTRDDSHLLLGLRDGKLIVITGDRTLK